MFKHIIILINVLFVATASFSQSFMPEFRCNNYGKTPQKGEHEYKKAGNSRSDTIDILNYDIYLDITDFTNQVIKGNCNITFSPKVNNINTLSLDLLKMNIDSIIYSGTPLSYSYNDTLLTVNFPTVLGPSDTAAVNVYYQGNPQTDPSGWGGFYFSGDYAFNLGVGFQANPHNYGRVWFPCYDNFVEHSTYKFQIKTADGRKAHCNGLLTQETTINLDTITRTWEMNDPIPTYLACVAVSDYETLSDTFITPGIDTVPVELAVRPADTSNLKSSFVNLDQALFAFEDWYGPFIWDKIGYSLVPFSSGAMEHATNIAYPRAAAGGNLNYETLMAHELSHHWWGDLATCETAGDMWINEGLASYSEHIFLEYVYGKTAYLKAVNENHADVIQHTHIREGKYRALSGIPHEYTYGEHVYNKGASVAHSLRGYMGDSLFRKGVKAVMNKFAFGNVNSNQFKNELVNATGLSHINDFFNDFVFQPGFAHFSIDSVISVQSGGNYETSVYVHQKLRGANQLYNNVPMEVTFYNSDWSFITDTIWLSGAYTDSVYTLPFDPVFTALNVNSRINQAVTSDQKTITSPGKYFFNLGKMTLTVDALSDSALVRVEHHWAKPDPIKNNTKGHIISDSRYWSVDGILPQNWDASASIIYDSKVSSGKMDSLLVDDTEDSLILLYRESPAKDWREYRYYSKNTLGSSTNQFGLILIDSLIKGEYTFANGESTLGLEENQPDGLPEINVFPNPTSDNFKVEDKSKHPEKKSISVFDINGKVMHQNSFSDSSTITTGNWKSGNYFISIHHAEHHELLYSGKIAVIK